MYRYTVSFDASTIDESRLRNLLAEELGVETCAISRSAAGEVALGDIPPPEPSASESDDPILQYAATVDMFAPRDVSRAKPDLEIANIARRCVTLVGQGKLHRVAHGIYSSAPATSFTQDDIEANRSLRSVEAPREISKSVNDNLLEFLAVGRRSSEVQDFLGVTRQRTHQRLNDLMNQGLVCRVPGPENSFIYALDERAIAKERAFKETKTPRNLSTNMRAVMKVLPDKGLVESKLIQQETGLNQSRVTKTLNNLAKNGLIETPRLGLHRCVALTEQGRRHPCRAENAQRLDPSDPNDVFGEPRASILLMLSEKGPLTTADISAEISYQASKGYGLPQLMTEMRRAGLIEKAPGHERGGHNFLTKDGRDVVELFHLYAVSDDVPTLSRAREDEQSGSGACSQAPS